MSIFSSISWFLINGGFFPGKTPHWRPERDIPDMQGKVVVVTGANTGIGYESIKYLLKAGAKVYALSRTSSKGERAVKELNDLKYKGEAIFVQCDLADLKSIRPAAEEIMAKEKEIHVTFCNAGIMLLSKQKEELKTAQGHEIQFGTNCLGHYHLVQCLKPAIIEAASHCQDGNNSVRIIFTSSSGHFMLTSNKLIKNWDLNDEVAKKYQIQEMYGRSKLGNIHLARKFADELESKGVFVASATPGNIQSELQRYSTPFEKYVIGLLLWPIYFGAITQLYAGTAADIPNLQRAYFAPWARRIDPHSSALDASLAQKTWDWCEEQSRGF